MSENQNIEYKQSWHDDYLKWVFNSCCHGTLKNINSCKVYGLPEPMMTEKNGGIEVSILASNQVGNEVSNQVGKEVSNQGHNFIVNSSKLLEQKGFSHQLGIAVTRNSEEEL